jgi:hypothetical protein
VICTVVYGVAFRRTGPWPQVWIPSFGVAAFLLGIGPVTAASVGGPYMGLFERLTIGASSSGSAWCPPAALRAAT